MALNLKLPKINETHWMLCIHCTVTSALTQSACFFTTMFHPFFQATVSLSFFIELVKELLKHACPNDF